MSQVDHNTTTIAKPKLLNQIPDAIRTKYCRVNSEVPYIIGRSMN